MTKQLDAIAINPAPKEKTVPEQLNAFEMAQKQFDHVAKLLKLDPVVS